MLLAWLIMRSDVLLICNTSTHISGFNTHSSHLKSKSSLSGVGLQGSDEFTVCAVWWLVEEAACSLTSCRRVSSKDLQMPILHAMETAIGTWGSVPACRRWMRRR